MSKNTKSTSRKAKGLNVIAKGKKVATLQSRQATRRFITRCYNKYLENGGKGRRAHKLVEVPPKYRQLFKVQPVGARI